MIALTGADVLAVWGFLSNILFSFWPIVLLKPVASTKSRGRLVRDMLINWVILAVARVVLFFTPDMTRWFIPEPQSTIFFFLAGAVLGGVLILQRERQKQKTLERARRLRSREQLLELSPVEFEEMVAELFRALGHQARRTGKSGDHGVDVIVKTRKGNTWIVQCKRWRRPVGENVVRDFYGTLEHEKAHGGLLIAVSGFSRAAQEWARGKPIRLMSGEEFISRWKKAMERTRAN